MDLRNEFHSHYRNFQFTFIRSMKNYPRNFTENNIDFSKTYHKFAHRTNFSQTSMYPKSISPKKNVFLRFFFVFFWVLCFLVKQQHRRTRSNENNNNNVDDRTRLTSFHFTSPPEKYWIQCSKIYTTIEYVRQRGPRDNRNGTVATIHWPFSRLLYFKYGNGRTIVDNHI